MSPLNSLLFCFLSLNLITKLYRLSTFEVSRLTFVAGLKQLVPRKEDMYQKRLSKNLALFHTGSLHEGSK